MKELLGSVPEEHKAHVIIGQAVACAPSDPEAPLTIVVSGLLELLKNHLAFVSVFESLNMVFRRTGTDITVENSSVPAVLDFRKRMRNDARVRTIGEFEHIMARPFRDIGRRYSRLSLLPLIAPAGEVRGGIAIPECDYEMLAGLRRKNCDMLLAYLSSEPALLLETRPVHDPHCASTFKRVERDIQDSVRSPLNAIGAVSEALFIKLGESPDIKPYIARIRAQIMQLKSYLDYLPCIVNEAETESRAGASSWDVTDPAYTTDRRK